MSFPAEIPRQHIGNPLIVVDNKEVKTLRLDATHSEEFVPQAHLDASSTDYSAGQSFSYLFGRCVRRSSLMVDRPK